MADVRLCFADANASVLVLLRRGQAEWPGGLHGLFDAVGPVSRTQQLVDEVARLPLYQQAKVLETIEAVVHHYKRSAN